MSKNSKFLPPKGAQQGFFGTRDLPHFRRDIGKVCFKFAGNVMRYTHGTENFFLFLFG